MKYDSSGQLDSGFATQGIFLSALPVADGPYLATAVAQDAAGGSSWPAERARRGDRAAADRRGAAGHHVRHGRTHGDPGGGTVQSMAIQPDGSILVGASNGDEQGRPMVVARLTPDGGVDASFGANG